MSFIFITCKLKQVGIYVQAVVREFTSLFVWDAVDCYIFGFNMYT